VKCKKIRIKNKRESEARESENRARSAYYQSQLTALADEAKRQEERHHEQMNQLRKTELVTRYDSEKKSFYEATKLYRDYVVSVNKLETEYNNLKSQVEEEGERGKFKEETNDSNALRLVLYGPTGAGKSTLANRICGDTSQKCDKGPFKTSGSTKSETKEISKTFIPKGRYDYAVSLTDQPGHSDTNGEDPQHANRLVEYLKGIEYINAIVLVRNFQDPRLDTAYQNMLKNLETMLGRRMWEHVILVFMRVEGPQVNNVNDVENYVKEFVTDLRKVMKLTPEESPISNVCLNKWEKFENPIKELINVHAASKDKFICSHLQSPLQIQLKKKKDCLEAATAKLNQEKKYLNDLINNITKFENDLKNLDNKFESNFKLAEIIKEFLDEEEKRYSEATKSYRDYIVNVQKLEQEDCLKAVADKLNEAKKYFNNITELENRLKKLDNTFESKFNREIELENKLTDSLEKISKKFSWKIEALDSTSKMFLFKFL